MIDLSLDDRADGREKMTNPQPLISRLNPNLAVDPECDFFGYGPSNVALTARTQSTLIAVASAVGLIFRRQRVASCPARPKRRVLPIRFLDTGHCRTPLVTS
jgi:hypothetical protein